LSSRRFDVGVKVKVDGLTSPDGRALNGEIGVIVEMRERSDRVGVRFDDSRDIKGIKLSNLSWDFSAAFPGTVGLDYWVFLRFYDKQVRRLAEVECCVGERTMLEALHATKRDIEKTTRLLL
jgi:hypothetical protein